MDSENAAGGPVAASHFRAAAHGGRLLAGSLLSLGHADVAEMAALSGFDWLLIDHEHGVSDWRDLQHQLQAIDAGGGTASIVRVAAIDAVDFKRVLDLGATGLMIPDVRSAEAAQRIVDYARVPPLGRRGIATSTRNVRYGQTYHEHVATINQQLVLMAQIESRAAIDALDAIAQVDGIDVLFVGPTDLGIDLGFDPARPDAPAYAKVLAEIAAVARRHGKAAGILARNASQAADFRRLGYGVISLGSDRGAVAQGLRANAGALRSLVE